MANYPNTPAVYVTNIYYLAASLGQKSGNGLAHGLSSHCNQGVGEGCIISSLDQNWRSHFQDGALTWMVAGRLSFSPHELSMGSLRVFMICQ